VVSYGDHSADKVHPNCEVQVHVIQAKVQSAVLK